MALSRELAGLEENMNEDRAGSTYVVKEGDTLSQIAEDAGTTVDELVALNGIENAHFFAGNVGQTIEELREEAGSPDVVIVDPPRAGLVGKALRRTGELDAPRVVYVSCNPTTLASDLQVLRDEYGYVLGRCRPVDMFPHTPHVESVSVLNRPR